EAEAAAATAAAAVTAAAAAAVAAAAMEAAEATAKETESSSKASFLSSGMGAETWMDKLSAPTTMQARNTLLGLMRKELGVIVARGHATLILARARSLHTQTERAAAGARGAPWFQRTGRSANGPEDAPAHADGAADRAHAP
ncbi:hypothetical protein T492DRAFT_871418, partial [Pavlovales sp. CCMP2436]